MSERMQFISRRLAGERISDLSQEFGISRQAGHELMRRFKRCGPDALQDRSSRPLHSPNRTPTAKVDAILALRKKHPTWGPKKLKQRLEVTQPQVRWPAASTIGVILDEAGVVKRRRKRRKVASARTTLRTTSAPNELWCMDYKGQFRLGNRTYCYPFTVTDHYSRYLLSCEAYENTQAWGARMALWAVFDAYGLPDAIRSDNGSPFASRGRLGLSRLAVELMRLGVQIEYITPGKPQENGRHERMHRTLKADATRPAAHSILPQQERFDVFRKTFNNERPHEALAMKTPAEVFVPPLKKTPHDLPELKYPLHDTSCRVSKSGHFHMPGTGSVFLGAAFYQQRVGLRQLDKGTWLVSFMDIDIGYVDVSTKRIIDLPEPANSVKV